MAYLVDISTVVPAFELNQDEMLDFIKQSLPARHDPNILRKVKFLSQKSGIVRRYSCIPDFKMQAFELYTENNFHSRVEQRMRKYREKLLPLASRAVNEVFQTTGVRRDEITHLITVSCTGMSAPGFEIQLADTFGLQHTEKIAINFMGCYAAIKALKHAKYIATADPQACVLIVCTELCSLHYSPPKTDEDIVASLLFADGASAAIVCGEENPLKHNHLSFHLQKIGSACIPNSEDLMTWELGSNQFKMYLGKDIAEVIGANIRPLVDQFVNGEMDHWAIHPGGIKILQEVKKQLGLSDESTSASMHVLENYGNMSSPTVLFVLKRILDKIKSENSDTPKKIFACAFGPGITVEMINMSSVKFSENKPGSATLTNAVQ